MPTVQIFADNSIAYEDLGGIPVGDTFSIERDDPIGALTVFLALDPASTAALGSDFLLSSKNDTFTFLGGNQFSIQMPPDTKQVEIDLTPLADAIAEPVETATLRLVPDPTASYDIDNIFDKRTVNILNASPLLVTPLAGSTSEDGGEATFSLVLAAPPDEDVAIALSSSDPSEGIVSPDVLEFAGPESALDAPWNVPQTVTVAGVDDSDLDGDTSYVLLLSANSTDDYFNGATFSIPLVNLDNETETIPAPEVVLLPELTVFSRDERGNPVELVAGGNVALEFGPVPVDPPAEGQADRAARLSVVLQNDGDAVLIFRGAELPPGFSFEDGPPIPLAPGESQTVNLLLEPGAIGPFEGTLTFDSDDLDEGEFQIPLRGTGVAFPELPSPLPALPAPNSTAESAPVDPEGGVSAAGSGADVLVGGSDRDLLLGLAGDDNLFGEGGDDRLYGTQGDDYLDGGDDDDDLVGGSGDDALVGGAGNDLLAGGPGNDAISGGPGRDRATGGAGADVLDGGDGDDTLLGGADDDAIAGGAGADELAGDEGNDELAGGAENDAIAGGQGDDLLAGDAGNDLLAGEAGDDVLVGGDGDDLLAGGGGDDNLQGGAGADRFVLGIGQGADLIFDFEAGIDRLVLSGDLAIGDVTLAVNATGVDLFRGSVSGGELLATVLVANLDAVAAALEG